MYSTNHCCLLTLTLTGLPPLQLILKLKALEHCFGTKSKHVYDSNTSKDKPKIFWLYLLKLAHLNFHTDDKSVTLCVYITQTKTLLATCTFFNVQVNLSINQGKITFKVRIIN